VLVLKTLKIENFGRDLLKELHSLTHKKRQKQGKQFLLDIMNEIPMTPLIQDLSEVSNIVPIDANWLTLHERNLEAMKSKYVYASLVDRSGIYSQFINLQPAYLPGAGEVFVGIWSISQIRRKFEITWTSN
jgi:hypothetical protein